MDSAPTRPLCAHLTRRGRPCRNYAADAGDPPACHVHRRQPLPTPGTPANFYFPNPTRDEARAIAAGATGGGLADEIVLVRVYLRQIGAYLDANRDSMPPTEVRHLTNLIFAGTRTIALLSRQPGGKSNEDMREALADLAEDYLDNRRS